jgi:hypothetical protein
VAGTTCPRLLIKPSIHPAPNMAFPSHGRIQRAFPPHIL